MTTATATVVDTLPTGPAPHQLGFVTFDCRHCGAISGEPCRTPSGKPPRFTRYGYQGHGIHVDRAETYISARRNRQMWFMIVDGDPRFGLEPGDIVRCVKYPYDSKVTVLFREEDCYDPSCNQYMTDVEFLGFVPRDMEVSLR